MLLTQDVALAVGYGVIVTASGPLPDPVGVLQPTPTRARNAVLRGLAVPNSLMMLAGVL